MAALRNGRLPVSESELLSNAPKSVDHLSVVVTGTRPGTSSHLCVDIENYGVRNLEVAENNKITFPQQILYFHWSDKEKVRGMSMNLWEVFVDTVVLKNGMSAAGEGQDADGLLVALGTTSGRIPILWMKTAAEEGVYV